jgi:choline dehydrogenase-like flavoprotein
MMIFTGKEIQEDRKENADVCVIGSGAGGGVAAAELAEGGVDVVLLEEGGYYPSKEFNSNPSEMLPKLYRDGGAE